MYDTELHVRDIASNSPSRVVNATPYQSIDGSWFNWSPDGSALSYGAVPLEADMYSGPTELFIASFVDPSLPPRRVRVPLDSYEAIYYSAWGADSRSIHWMTNNFGGMPEKYYWMNVSDPLSEPQLVQDNTPGPAGWWSPDGYRLAYELPEYLSGVESAQLFVVDVEGGTPSAPRPLHPELQNGSGHCDWFWSSSGRWIVYSAEAERPECDLYAVRVEAGAIGPPLPLNLDLRTDGTLYPAPGSEKVVFAGQFEGSGVELFIVDLSNDAAVGPTAIERAIPAGSTLSYLRWIDAERFIYGTERNYVPTRWFADLRGEAVSIHEIELPSSWNAFWPIEIIPTTDDSVQVLYKTCEHEQIGGTCDVLEWTWLDVTHNAAAVPLGLFCNDDGRVAFSPDGRRAVLDVRTSTNDTSGHDLYVLEFRGGAPGRAVRVDRSRRSLVGNRPTAPVWSPTGYAFAFVSDDERLVWAEADGQRVHDVSTPDEAVLGFAWRPR
jgi:hypothetical protein